MDDRAAAIGPLFSESKVGQLVVDGNRSESAVDEARRLVEQLRSDNSGEPTDGRPLESFSEALSDTEKIALHQHFKQGDISEEAAALLFGRSLQAIGVEVEAFEEAMELDRSGVFQE